MTKETVLVQIIRINLICAGRCKREEKVETLFDHSIEVNRSGAE